MVEKQKALTVSIIIPVYNEENYLRACLDSIAAQAILPLEVIVVDNNSTDSTVDIAKMYSFVRILSEGRQHQVFSQHSGFNAARGDILARIDADTILPTEWVLNVRRAFHNDPKTIAVSGGGVPYDMYARKLTEFLISRFYEVAAITSGHKMMWGSNCALRASGWIKIKDKVLLRSDIWEDYDLAFCLSEHGRIKTLKNIQVSMSLRSGEKPFFEQLSYQFRAVRTYRLRMGFGGAALFFILWLGMLGVYLMVLLDRLIRALMSQGSIFLLASGLAPDRKPRTETKDSSRG